MANIPLQSITFPGLSDKYTTPTVDTTLTQTGAAADAKKTGDEIGAIKNDLSDGTMTVNNAENAEQLTSTVGIEDTAPYLFRTSGGSNDIGDREDARKIVGVTVVNNQLFDPSTVLNVEGLTITTVQTGTYRFNGTLASTLSGNIGATYLANHVYYLRSGRTVADIVLSNNNTWQSSKTDYIIKPNAEWRANLFVSAGTYENADFTPQIVDLTQDFGTTIADYIYSLEQATAGAGVAWLKKHFPKQFDAGYQAYDAGSMQSVSGLTEHKMVGFNQWDEQWEAYGPVQIKSKNRIRLFGGVTYYAKTPSVGITLYFKETEDRTDNIGQITVVNNTFVVPSNANYAVMYTGANYGNVYNHDICINLSDPTKNGTYEPYEAHSYALDSDVVLRGIPKLDSNNQLYYDGDEYLPDGTVNRRYGVVDLGTLNWEAISGHAGYFKAETTEIINTPNGIIANALCPKYVTVKGNELSTKDKAISVDMNNAYQIQISDSAHSASSASDFKTAMSGVMLLYEKRLPTTETALPYQETQIVDDFGTEEFVLADGAFPVPVGHNTMYQNNLRAKLEMSPDSPDGDGLYVVQQESGENTYVPLASTATIQDILTRLTALENA